VSRGLIAAVLITIGRSSSVAQSAQNPPAKPNSPPRPSSSQPDVPDTITLRIVNTDLRTAVQIIQQYLDKPVVYSGQTAGPQVTLELPRAVPRADVPRLLRGLLDSQGYELIDDTLSGMYRARAKESPRTIPTASSPSVTQQVSPAGRQSSSPELFVIALRHVRATEVANTINALFGRGSGQVSNAQSGRVPTLSDELRANQIPPIDAPPSPQAVPGTAGRTANLTGDVTIVPDPRGNILLVRANRADFQLIQAAVNNSTCVPHRS